MSKEASAYIFSFDSKSGVFTLTSSKDQLTIDSKHKKYEWLKGQEAGRVIKISATGRWNSSRDYNDLYKSIKPKKKVLKKSKTSKTNTDKAGEYCFSFIENEFILTDQNGGEIKITSKHKKFEWLQSQDSGRVIKISEKGRWNSSKDYDGLYEKIKSSKKKSTKPANQGSKTDSSGEIKKLKEQIKKLENSNKRLLVELSLLSKREKNKPFQIVFEVNSDMLKEKDYDSILVDLQNKDGSRITSMQYYRNLEAEWQIVDHMIALKRPDKIKFWAHSKSRGWAESVEISPNSDGLDYEGLRGVKIYYSDKVKKSLEYMKSRANYLEQQIKSLKSKTLSNSKPKKVIVPKPQPVAKRYRARITATLSYYHKIQSIYPGKQTETLDVEITTNELFKKPSQSYFISYLKLAANKTYYTQSMKLGMDIYQVTGLYLLTNVMYEKFKISGIEFISIEEY